jgi:hypothetical protein
LILFTWITSILTHALINPPFPKTLGSWLLLNDDFAFALIPFFAPLASRSRRPPLAFAQEQKGQRPLQLKGARGLPGRYEGSNWKLTAAERGMDFFLCMYYNILKMC